MKFIYATIFCLVYIGCRQGDSLKEMSKKEYYDNGYIKSQIVSEGDSTASDSTLVYPQFTRIFYNAVDSGAVDSVYIYNRISNEKNVLVKQLICNPIVVEQKIKISRRDNNTIEIASSEEQLIAVHLFASDTIISQEFKGRDRFNIYHPIDSIYFGWAVEWSLGEKIMETDELGQSLIRYYIFEVKKGSLDRKEFPYYFSRYFSFN